jgi:response regulator RpfG family c-di-GMP phosphodiesterase
MTTKTKVLCIDDELNVLKACKRLLHRAGFDVTTTDDPEEAKKLVQAESFAVVISDQRMPIVEGTELLEQIHELSPQTVRILLTGYADLNASIDAINRGGVFRYLTKPWDDNELTAIVSQAADNYNLTAENQRLQDLTERQNSELTTLNEELEDRVARRTEQVRGLVTRLEETLGGTSEVLGTLAEKHSPTLGNHGRRVATLSMKLAEHLQVEDDDLFQLRFAATLHDIGKIGISQKILTRERSAQTGIEKELLDQHVIHGEELVASIPKMETAAMFVRHHHELLDGTGFPDRLTGDAIPLGARIIAVASAFDNLMNSRKDYHESCPDEALAAVRKNALSSFDPTVVDALANCLSTTNPDELSRESDVDMNPCDLVEGLVLTRDLTSSRGLLLLAAGTQLTEDSITLIRRFRRDALDGVFVERRKSENDGESTTPVEATEELQPA